jgi:hypothetical protein
MPRAKQKGNVMPISRSEERLNLIERSRDLVEFQFKIKWRALDISLKVNSSGKITVKHLNSLPEHAQIFWQRVIDRANEVAENPTLLEVLQTHVDALPRGRGARMATSPLLPAADDPFDALWVSYDIRAPARCSQLETALNQLIPAFNVGMLLLSNFLLIPGIPSSTAGMSIALATSAMAFFAQCFSNMMLLHFGAPTNMRIQDFFSLLTVSIKSFSGMRVVAAIFLNRALELGSATQDSQLGLVTGIISIIIAAIAALASWYVPSMEVMGPRLQATAIELVRQCEKIKNGEPSDPAFRENLLRVTQGRLGVRFFCPSRINTTTTAITYPRDKRMVMPLSATTMLIRLGVAFVKAKQLSEITGINQNALEPMLLALVGTGSLYPLVNMPIQLIFPTWMLHPRVSTSLRFPAMSRRYPAVASGIKWVSEGAAVLNNSLLNPTIAFYFVFLKLLDFFNQQGLVSGLIGTIILLSLTIVLNLPSLGADLKSRFFFFDRHNGGDLTPLLDRATTVANQRQLIKYATSVIDSIEGGVSLHESTGASSALGVVIRH